MDELIQLAKKEAGRRWNSFDEATKSACIIMQDCLRQREFVIDNSLDETIDRWANIIRTLNGG